MEDDGLVSVQHKGRIDKYGKWQQIRDNVVNCIRHHNDIEAEYDRRLIYDGDILNCYGIKNTKESGNLVKLGLLFDYEKGSLQSENNIDGEYNFITASEDWKTHYTFDHNCEALVYAVSAGGSLGRSHYVNGKFIASNLCLILTLKENKDYPINLKFYNLYLNAIRKQIVNELADGTSKLTISPHDLMEYYIEYIPIDTQNEIVKYYQEHIESLQLKLDAAKREVNGKINHLI